MLKRYQVFVSSTFQDLQEERDAVTRVLLRRSCFPAGMEFFVASNKDPWSIIEMQIRQCDYLLVIIAGRYGSIGPDGRSYTEMEYRYALEQGVPVVGFLHAEPKNLPESKRDHDITALFNLEQFREFVKQNEVAYWQTAAELAGEVALSLEQLEKECPRPGWIRGGQSLHQENTAPDRNSIVPWSQEIVAKMSIVYLSYYDATLPYEVEANSFAEAEVTISLERLYLALAPYLLEPVPEDSLRDSLSYILLGSFQGGKVKFNQNVDGPIHEAHLHEPDFQKIKMLLRNLKLIESSGQDTRGSGGTLWKNTELGEEFASQRILKIEIVAENP